MKNMKNNLQHIIPFSIEWYKHVIVRAGIEYNYYHFKYYAESGSIADRGMMEYYDELLDWLSKRIHSK